FNFEAARQPEKNWGQSPPKTHPGYRWRRRLSIGYRLLASAVQRYLVSVSQTVCFTRHADHREQLTERFLRQSRLLGSFRMRMNTVIAIVNDAYRDVNHLLRERIECAGRHHLF